MWFYVQMALQLLTVGLTAAICFSVAHSSLHMQSLIRKPRGSQIGRQDQDKSVFKGWSDEIGAWPENEHLQNQVKLFKE
jgi:hypothetical protein